MNPARTPTAPTPLLEARGVSKRFGKFQALTDVDLQLAAGERRALTGPNGAGKSTFISAVGGQLGGIGGQLTLRGESIDGLHAPKIARRLIGRTSRRERAWQYWESSGVAVPTKNKRHKQK